MKKIKILVFRKKLTDQTDKLCIRTNLEKISITPQSANQD